MKDFCTKSWRMQKAQLILARHLSYTMLKNSSILKAKRLKMMFQNHFYILLTCHEENAPPVTDTAPPAGLV